MNAPKIILSKRFQPELFEICHREVFPIWAHKKMEQRINETWKVLLTYYAEHGMRVWDAPHYRLNNIAEVSSGSCRLELSVVMFSTVKSLIEIRRHCPLPDSYNSYHLNVGALIKTSDNFYLFGARSNTAYANKTDIIGGGLQVDELPIASGNDIRKTLFKEMQEEANISETQVVSSEVMGILLSSSTGLIILFDVCLNSAKAELVSRFVTRSDQEMADLIFVPATELVSFLEGLHDYRKLIPKLLH